MHYPPEFDVIVIGGGHAGAEAALAAARMGCATLLLTHNIETLGQMSCNPSIGGIGKGHLVKEVDALGGAMAEVTDEAGIQFRILNGSKGPAVRATRAQADRILYKAALRRRLEGQPNLWLFQQGVDDLLLQGERVAGAVTQTGIEFRARAVVLTAGTFLDGRIHIGLRNFGGGRAGDAPSLRLAARLEELGLPRGRLKTGTPPRLDGRTIDFSVLQAQPGDLDPVPVFGFLGAPEQLAQRVAIGIVEGGRAPGVLRRREAEDQRAVLQLAVVGQTDEPRQRLAGGLLGAMEHPARHRELALQTGKLKARVAPVAHRRAVVLGAGGPAAGGLVRVAHRPVLRTVKDSRERDSRIGL